MALVVCHDCRQEVSDLAEACPQCGRPMAGRGAGAIGAFELGAILAVFGLGSITYSLLFPEHLVVEEARVKFWFGFQLVAIALAVGALGWWHRSEARTPT